MVAAIPVQGSISMCSSKQGRSPVRSMTRAVSQKVGLAAAAPKPA